MLTVDNKPGVLRMPFLVFVLLWAKVLESSVQTCDSVACGQAILSGMQLFFHEILMWHLEKASLDFFLAPVFLEAALKVDTSTRRCWTRPVRGEGIKWRSTNTEQTRQSVQDAFLPRWKAVKSKRRVRLEKKQFFSCNGRIGLHVGCSWSSVLHGETRWCVVLLFLKKPCVANKHNKKQGS